MFQILKLSNMIKMKYAKFIFKFKSNLLNLFSFDNYFMQLERIGTIQDEDKIKITIIYSIGSGFGRKRLYYSRLKLWETIRTETKQLFFFTFKMIYLVLFFIYLVFGTF